MKRFKNIFLNLNNNIIILIFGILFLNLIMPVLAGIFYPYTILYSEKMYFVIVELLIFNILNYIFFKIKNEKLKKILIFMSIFVYLPGYNIILLFTSLVYQSLNSKKERYILINIFNTLAYFIWYFRVYFIDIDFKIFTYLIGILILAIITLILFLIFKKEIYKSEILKNIFNTSIIGIVVHHFFYIGIEDIWSSSIDPYIEMKLKDCYIYKDLKNEIILKKLLNYFSNEELTLHNGLYIISLACILIMFLFYYYNISIYKKEISNLITAIFLFILAIILTDFELRIVNYLFLSFVMIMYIINHLKNKYYKIKE